MRYVSIVGTQIIATLNPLLAMAESDRKCDGVSLLATEYEKSRENAEKLRQYLIDNRLFASDQISIEEICSVPTPGTSRPQAHERLACIAKEKPVCFNVAGGMNYQVGLCVGALTPGRDAFVYPESQGVYSWEFTQNKVIRRVLPLPSPLKILAVLGLQGVEATTNNRQISLFPWKVLKKTNISLPRPYEKQVRIEDVQFDFVWNRGNELCFLRAIWTDSNDQRSDEDRLADQRSLINLANSRQGGFADLFHRNIGVMTNIPNVAARLKIEAGQKIVVFDYFKDRDLANDALRRFIDAGIQQESLDGPNIHAIAGRDETGETLALSLAPNLMPTMLSLWSHRPARAILFYTPGHVLIERFRKAFITNDSLLPPELAVLEFRPVSIRGVEIFEMQAPASPFAVNITPGSKGQGVCLALWAGLHGGSIYTIRTHPAAICRLNPLGEERPLNGPSPEEYLRLSGATIESLGKKGQQLTDDKPYNLLRQFFQAIIKADIKIGKLIRRHETISVNGFECRLEHINKVLHLTLGVNGEKYHFQWEKGEWFEEFVGHALCVCGADDVQVRVRTPWPDEIKQKLATKYPGRKLFMSDIDVVARFGGDYLVVSCKATKKNPGPTDREKIAQEAEAHAHQFQRFCVPMVCILGHEGTPIRSTDGIPIFGYQTLVDEKALHDLIESRFSELRTTQHE